VNYVQENILYVHRKVYWDYQETKICVSVLQNKNYQLLLLLFHLHLCDKGYVINHFSGCYLYTYAINDMLSTTSLVATSTLMR